MRFTDVSKTFRIPKNRAHTLKERVLRPRSSRAYTELEALKSVSFEIEKGEFFGVIGRNGSGKSTLLKCLAGIYQPGSGKVEVAGRISPFLELGVGFRPELTALENVVLNASLMGIPPKVARASFDEILAFAELEEFVDLKFKNYSSGMAMRLAFAAAIQAHAEILLIDEALAVGDDLFKEKCYRRFEEMKEEGRTIVFVTHALSLVTRFCDRVLLLERGSLIELGEPRPTVALYEKRNRTLTVETRATDQADGAVAPPRTAPTSEPEHPHGVVVPHPRLEHTAPTPVIDQLEPPTVQDVGTTAAEADAEPAATQHAAPAPSRPPSAAVRAAWIESGRGQLERMADVVAAARLHVHVSFPTATGEPVLGAIVAGRTGDAVRVSHTLQEDLRGRSVDSHVSDPCALRFYVSTRDELYLAAVAVHEGAELGETREPGDDQLAFSVFGCRLNRASVALPDATAERWPAPLSPGGSARSSHAVGDVWLEDADADRERVFRQPHDGHVSTRIALPGISADPVGARAQPPDRDAPYSVKLYVYTEAGHYGLSIGITPPQTGARARPHRA